MKLSIIIPAYNEEARITKTLIEVSEFLKKQAFQYEILVVDDEKMVLEMVVTLLNHLNYTVFSAENGQIAFDILSEKKDKILNSLRKTVIW